MTQWVQKADCIWRKLGSDDRHSTVCYTTMTCQSSQCQLQASEDGKWPVAALDFIHTTIVEKQCQVTVKQEPKAGQPLVVSELLMQ